MWLSFSEHKVVFDILSITSEQCPIIWWIPAPSGPLWLTWFNFNPRKDKNNIYHIVCDEIIYPFLNFNGCTGEA